MIRAIPKKPTGSIKNQMIVGRNPSRYGEFTTNKDPKPEPKIKQKPQRESLLSWRRVMNFPAKAGRKSSNFAVTAVG